MGSGTDYQPWGTVISASAITPPALARLFCAAALLLRDTMLASSTERSGQADGHATAAISQSQARFDIHGHAVSGLRADM